jgi:filamentous hemagglutinin
MIQVIQAWLQFPAMSRETGPWVENHAQFKGEGGQMTTQLGCGKALEIFNDGLIHFEKVK